MFQADKEPTLSITELTGNPITFKSRFANMPLADCKVSIPVTQQGSGTPSPTNIRDFVGFTQAVIGQTSDYGKYFKGLLNGTYGFVDLGDLSWQYQEEYETFRSSVNRNVEVGTPNCICSVYLFNPDAIGTNPSSISSKLNDKEITTYKNENNQGRFVIKDTNYTDVDSFKTAVSGMKVIYESAEPSTPVTPEQFATLCQAFGITGNTYQITFGQTVYSAILDVLTGKLSVTHGIVDLGDLEWNLAPGVTRFYSNDITDISLEADFTDMFCSGYNVISSAVSFSNMPDKSIKRGQSNATISIRDLDYTDADNFTTAVTGMKLVYELAEPIQIPLGGYLIEALKGENNLISSIGTITAKIVEEK